MDTFIKSFVVCLFLTFLLNLACAFDDDDFEKKWKRTRHRPALPPATVFIIFVAVTIAAGCISIFCFCLRRQPGLYNASPHIPRPLGPAGPVVTSGARTHTSLEARPLVSGGAPSSSATSHPQQTWYPQPTAPFPEGGPRMVHYTATPGQPSAAPLPLTYAPFYPPPPYIDRIPKVTIANCGYNNVTNSITQITFEPAFSPMAQNASLLIPHPLAPAGPVVTSGHKDTHST